MSDDCTEPYTNRDKWVVSLIVGLVALLMFSPFSFSVMNAITNTFGVRTATPKGLTNLAGLLLMSMIFFLIVRLILL